MLLDRHVATLLAMTSIYGIIPALSQPIGMNHEPQAIETYASD